MIYTLTLNPAIDYFMGFDSKISKHQKTNNFKLLVGGKGINASIILNELGIKNKAIIITGGIIGKKLLSLMHERNLDFINIDSKIETRINNKSNFQGITYEMNSSGNKVNNKLINLEILNLLKSSINIGDTLMIMGSYPPGYSFEDLEIIVKAFYDKGIKLVFDLSKNDLIKLSKYNPEVIKPNKKELSQIFKVDIKTKEEALFYAKKMHKMGAKRVLVSFDKSGSIYYDGKSFAFIDGINIKEVNGSGSGDSMIAGFIAGLYKNLKLKEILKLASGAATATAASEEMATKEKINFYKEKINIKIKKENK